MARGRLISRTLATSGCFARLYEVEPALAEFAQVLYVFLVTHSDDFGREEGDAAAVKYRFHPRAPRSVDEFERALDALEAVDLITRYDADGRTFYQIRKFFDHQRGLHKRTASHFPEPPDPPNGSGNFPEIPGTSGNPREFPPEEKRREEKGRRSRSEKPRALARLSLDDVRTHLRAALHAHLDAHPRASVSELADVLKDLSRPLRFTWNFSRELAALVESVVGERDTRKAG